MSRKSMSDIAFEIECALDDGLSYDEVIDNLTKQYGITRGGAISWINATLRMVDEYERYSEIQFEAEANAE